MKLQQERSKIDEIDQEIIKLLDRRIKSVKEIGKYKRDNAIPILDESREKLIFEKIMNMEIENKKEICEIYSELMNVTKAMQ